MELIINREELLPVLGKVVGVVERRQTLPILGNLLFSAREERAEIRHARGAPRSAEPT